jgi:hypothetical protein
MPDAQATSQTSGSTPAQQSQPCPDPTPAPAAEPKPPCPKPKPCAEWPEPPCPPPPPDPCAEDKDDESGPSEQAPPPPTGDACVMPAADDPAKQLAAMQTLLQQEQRQAEQLQRVTASIDDLTQRIQALQQMIDGETDLMTAYKEFYRTTEFTRHQTECFISSRACDINLSDAETHCIDGVVATVDARIAQAEGDYQAQRDRVDRYNRKWLRAKWKLENAQTMYDFFSKKLKEGVQAKLDLVTQLTGLADPTKGRCEAAVYLRQLKELLGSLYGAEGACFPPSDLSIGTFLDCWSADCYADGYNRAVVELNNAAWAEKCRKTLLDAATARLTALEAAAKDARTKRWEAILAGVKAEECCKSGGKC